MADDNTCKNPAVAAHRSLMASTAAHHVRAPAIRSKSIATAVTTLVVAISKQFYSRLRNWAASFGPVPLSSCLKNTKVSFHS